MITLFLYTNYFENIAAVDILTQRLLKTENRYTLEIDTTPKKVVPLILRHAAVAGRHAVCFFLAPWRRLGAASLRLS